jgi:sugar phosphate permease
MNRRLVLLACFLTVFVSYATRYGYGIILPEMLPALGITKTQAGVIYTSFFIAYTLASPVLGLLADRSNTRFLLSSFVALLGAGACLMAASSSIPASSLFFALAGIGSAACWAPVMALARRFATDRNRGRTLALVDTGSAAGIVTMSALLPLVVVNSWRTAWLALGITALVAAVLNFLVIRDPRTAPSPSLPPPAGRTALRSSRERYREVLSNHRFWLIGLAYLFTGYSLLVPFTFLSTYAVEELQQPYVAASRLIMVIGLGAVAGKLTLGALSDRTGRVRMMMLCSVLLTAGDLGFFFFEGAALWVFTGVFSLGYGTCFAMYAASAADYFSAEDTGGIVGLWTMFLGIGSVLAPVVSGWSADTTGTLSWSFVIAAGAGALSLLLLLPLWKLRPVSPSAQMG